MNKNRDSVHTIIKFYGGDIHDFQKERDTISVNYKLSNCIIHVSNYSDGEHDQN